jgi:hypothetical protein
MAYFSRTHVAVGVECECAREAIRSEFLQLKLAAAVEGEPQGNGDIKARGLDIKRNISGARTRRDDRPDNQNQAPNPS